MIPALPPDPDPDLFTPVPKDEFGAVFDARCRLVHLMRITNDVTHKRVFRERIGDIDTFISTRCSASTLLGTPNH